jgi:plastocyanin
LATAAALAGCGPGPSADAPDRTVTIALTDFRPRPQDVRVDAGRVTFRVRNEGRLPHNLSLRGPQGRVLMKISTLLPGETGSATVRLRRGTYTIFCVIGNHEVLGEHGTVHVR